MKKGKIKLQDIKLLSFITTIRNTQTLRGGGDTSDDQTNSTTRTVLTEPDTQSGD